MRQNPHGGDIYTKKCRVDFSVNVNPLGAPESVKEAVRKSAESVEQYPDALCRDLTRALSEKEQLPEENILFANGAAELIFALTQALRPKKALIAAPDIITSNHNNINFSIFQIRYNFFCIIFNDIFYTN